MAPEQAVGNNDVVSSVTDVYGLGAVLYQLLTGHPPFAGGTTYETIKLVLETEPRQPRQLNPKIDRDLSTICLKSLEKDPSGVILPLSRWPKISNVGSSMNRFGRGTLEFSREEGNGSSGIQPERFQQGLWSH